MEQSTYANDVAPGTYYVIPASVLEDRQTDAIYQALTGKRKITTYTPIGSWFSKDVAPELLAQAFFQKVQHFTATEEQLNILSCLRLYADYYERTYRYGLPRLAVAYLTDTFCRNRSVK